MRSLHRMLHALAIGGGLLIASRDARAALDEVVDKGASQKETIAGHALRVRATGNVRELTGADGKVFAATWTGPANLRALLGTHWASYEAAVRAQHRGHHHIMSFRTPELTAKVVAYGRSFEGRVALTRNLPKGLTLDALH